MHMPLLEVVPCWDLTMRGVSVICYCVTDYRRTSQPETTNIVSHSF